MCSSNMGEVAYAIGGPRLFPPQPNPADAGAPAAGTPVQAKAAVAAIKNPADRSGGSTIPGTDLLTPAFMAGTAGYKTLTGM